MKIQDLKDKIKYELDYYFKWLAITGPLAIASLAGILGVVSSNVKASREATIGSLTPFLLILIAIFFLCLLRSVWYGRRITVLFSKLNDLY